MLNTDWLPLVSSWDEEQSCVRLPQMHSVALECPQLQRSEPLAYRLSFLETDVSV